MFSVCNAASLRPICYKVTLILISCLTQLCFKKHYNGLVLSQFVFLDANFMILLFYDSLLDRSHETCLCPVDSLRENLQKTALLEAAPAEESEHLILSGLIMRKSTEEIKKKKKQHLK